MKRVAWLAPETRRSGIRDYAAELWPDVAERLKFAGYDAHFQAIETADVPGRWERDLRDFDLIHVQHEYGEFGRKIPGLYGFPRIVRRLRSAAPRARLIATAHSVLPPDYQLPTQGRGWQSPVRRIANLALLPVLKRTWGPLTWGLLDGVIVHSALQIPWVQAAGCARVVEIPHFVPKTRRVTAQTTGNIQKVVVFGFISPEKGQHLAIEALAFLPKEVHLVIAGGIRRSEDAGYREHCRAVVDRLGLIERVHFLGYIPGTQVDAVYADSILALAPFMETSGSGSLAQAFCRSWPILASDHPINLEVARRIPNALSTFRLGDASDLARQVAGLLASPQGLQELSEGARRYAETFSAPLTAEKHVNFYGALL